MEGRNNQKNYIRIFPRMEGHKPLYRKSPRECPAQCGGKNTHQVTLISNFRLQRWGGDTKACLSYTLYTVLHA